MRGLNRNSSLVRCNKSFPILVISVLSVPLWFLESKINHRGTEITE